MFKKIFATVLLLSLVLLLLPSLVLAGNSNAFSSLYGLVYDTVDGEVRPVSYGKAELSRVDGAQKQGTIIKKGSMKFDNVLPGEYQLKVTVNTYRTTLLCDGEVFPAVVIPWTFTKTIKVKARTAQKIDFPLASRDCSGFSIFIPIDGGDGGLDGFDLYKVQF